MPLTLGFLFITPGVSDILWKEIFPHRDVAFQSVGFLEGWKHYLSRGNVSFKSLLSQNPYLFIAYTFIPASCIYIRFSLEIIDLLLPALC